MNQPLKQPATNLANLVACPKSMVHHEPCGIKVRAKGPDGHYGEYDLAHLSIESVLAHIRSRGGRNHYAESIVLKLLGFQA